MARNYPNSGSLIDAARASTHTGLSTSIIIKVDGNAVGAIQSLRVTTTRNIEKVREVGFDGFLEAVPNQPTEVTLDVERVYFDSLRLPESFSRYFKNIQCQRIPFNIDVYDMGRAESPETNSVGVDVTTFHNCWFRQYSYPFLANNYIITETAAIVAEFVSNVSTPSGGVRGQKYVSDSQGVENWATTRPARGSLDFEGIVNASSVNIA